MQKLLGFFSELLRRKVVRLLFAYIVIFFVLAQGYASLYPAFDLPDWTLRAFMAVGIALIPVLAWFSWRYDITPPQLVRDAKDLESSNPALTWAMQRHDNLDAGFVLLKWKSDGDTTTERRFFRAVSIGRGLDNDVNLSDDRVSRHHAVIWAEGGRWYVRDMNSANGTFLNHTPVTTNTPLPQSSELRLHAAGPTIAIIVDKPAQTRIT
jgi:hypothetical protein